MKNKYQAWMVVGRDVSYPEEFEDTLSGGRNCAIRSFISRWGDIVGDTWKKAYRHGYRCVRCTIEYEVPE